MLPTNFYIYQKAIRKARLRSELSVILSHIENDRYLTEEAKTELRYGLYLKLRFTYWGDLMDKVKVLYPARSGNTALKKGMICELLEIIPKEEAGAFTWPEKNLEEERNYHF